METYKNYFQNHSTYWINIKKASLKDNKEMGRRLWYYINTNDKVLEIGTWLWDFTNYCLYKWIKDYSWIEIDEWIKEKLQNEFSNYKILCIDAIAFFESSTEKFDVIYMSHVFEHFTIGEGIVLAKYIHEHLTEKGKWINIMPNAGCISGCLGRYSDITHKTIYSSNSFNQVLLEAWFYKNNVHHFNIFPNNFVKRILAKLIWKLLWVEYNTFQLMTIITNKDNE